MCILLLALIGCSDNLHGVDARQAVDDVPPAVDAVDPCPDTVKSIQAGNPGSDAASYPAPGWWSDDTRANGTVSVDSVLGVPPGFGCRSAHLTTGASTASPSADKAQLISFTLAGTPLSTITTVSYWSYRSSASIGGPAVALALNVSITGSTVPGGFATLVYEPYQQSAGMSAIVENTWQQWNATAITPGDGVWWTNKIANPNPGSQASPQSWAAFQALYSDAKVHGYGFNIGSSNPNMIVGGDGLVFGATTTDF
jgi:hypothetical protein